MNRKIFSTCLSIALLSGPVVALADDPKPSESTTEKKVTTESGTATSKAHTVVGTVKEFEAGKTLKVAVGKKTRSFSLDASKAEVSVDSDVAVGKKVKVIEAKNPQGVKTITVKMAS